MIKLVSIVMGSDSDLDVMQECANVLKEFDVSYEMQVMSAHRTPDLVAKFSGNAAKAGTKVIIA